MVTESGYRHGLHDNDLSTIKLICDELVSNIWRHAYGGGSGAIEFGVEFAEDICLLRFADDGPAFDPTAMHRPDTGAPIADRPIGGLGVFFVQEYADQFEYKRRDGQNVVEVRIRISRDGG